jgi:hypothetical protein
MYDHQGNCKSLINNKQKNSFLNKSAITMKKAKILLSAAGILSVIAGTFAFKNQHKFAGRYYCTAIYCSTGYFLTKYTTGIIAITTLYCSLIVTATKCKTYKVITNI